MIKRLQQWKMARTIKKHRDNKNLVMGVTWYRPEQWHLLQEISEDKENFAKTYEESLVDSENKMNITPFGRTIVLDRRTPWSRRYIPGTQSWAYPLDIHRGI